MFEIISGEGRKTPRRKRVIAATISIARHFVIIARVIIIPLP